jgi:two-component system OmpR family response regulator
MRILVVEDDEKIAGFILNGLKQSGFTADKASDGEEAFSLCGLVTYDAIVLDIMLPKLDGVSVIRRIRRDKNLVPVLLLSAMASVENRVAGLQAGADDYLTKPFAFSELLARVQALIRRASSLRLIRRGGIREIISPST